MMEGTIVIKKRNRINRFSDSQWNELSVLISDVKTYQAYPRNIRVYTSDVSTASTYLRDIVPGIWKAENKKGYVWLHFRTKENRNEALKQINKIKGHPILSYNPDNPLIAYTDIGYEVHLTKADNYSNSTYKDSQGNTVVAANMDNIPSLASDKEETGTSKTTTYILIGVGVVAVVALVYVILKKMKIIK